MVGEWRYEGIENIDIQECRGQGIEYVEGRLKCVLPYSTPASLSHFPSLSSSLPVIPSFLHFPPLVIITVGVCNSSSISAMGLFFKDL